MIYVVHPKDTIIKYFGIFAEKMNQLDVSMYRRRIIEIVTTSRLARCCYMIQGHGIFNYPRFIAVVLLLLLRSNLRGEDKGSLHNRYG